jgi:hypothetical protein
MLHPSPLPPGFIPPCLPTACDRCKSGPDWVHEIKHDGYRLIARRNGDRVRLYTRRGYNWADRYPRILEALRQKKVAAQNAEELAFMRDVSTRSLSLASGQGAQRGRISAARQWHAWFGRHGGIARFANAEAVGKSRFVLGGSVEDFGAWLGLVPKQISTGDRPYSLFPAEVCERMRRDGGSVLPAHANTGDPNGPFEAGPLIRPAERSS